MATHGARRQVDERNKQKCMFKGRWTNTCSSTSSEENRLPFPRKFDNFPLFISHHSEFLISARKINTRQTNYVGGVIAIIPTYNAALDIKVGFDVEVAQPGSVRCRRAFEQAMETPSKSELGMTMPMQAETC